MSLGENRPPGLGLVLELIDQHNDFYSQPGRSFSIAVSWETIFPLAHTCVVSILILYIGIRSMQSRCILGLALLLFAVVYSLDPVNYMSFKGRDQ